MNRLLAGLVLIAMAVSGFGAVTFDAHKNLIRTSVATAPSPAASGTSLIVTAGYGANFPTPPFNCTVWPASAATLDSNSEIIRVTAVVSDTLTIVRAQEGTSARTILVGDQISLTATAKSFEDIETAVNGLLTNPAFPGYVDMAEIALPSAPGANIARIYSIDDGTTTKVQMRDSAGVTNDLTHFKSLLGSSVLRTTQSKFEDTKDVGDWGIVGNGVSIAQAKLDAIGDYLDDTSARVLIHWPGGDYLFPATWALTNKRGFHFVGDGSTSVQPKTRFRVNGTGAGHRGVMSLTSCSDFSFRGIEFVVGSSGADQAFEVKADDIPSLSSLEGIWEHCVFRRFSGTAEFTYAALYIRNSGMMQIVSCTFPTAAIAMRLGNNTGIETGTYGDGHVAQIAVRYCWLFGDLERVHVSGPLYEGNFFDIKTASDSQPSVMTAVGTERIRNETLVNNYCQPAATNKTRVFYVQGTNSLSHGLTAFGNRIAEVTTGFDLINGYADIFNNTSYQDGATDELINIRSTAVNVFGAGHNNVTALVAAGGSEVVDATSGVYKQPAFGALSPATTQGDLIVRGATVNDRLPVGPFGGILQANATSPIWSTPTNLVVLFDEHLQSSATGGALNLGNINSGTAATITSVTGSGTAPGIVELQTGTDTTGRATYRNGLGTMRFGSGRTIFGSRVRVPTLSDGTDTFTIWIGFLDNGAISGDAVDGAYFIYSSASTFYTDTTQWAGKTSNNSTRTEVGSSVTITANQFYTLWIDVNAAGTQVDFYVDGVLIGSSTTNIPTGAGREFGFGYKIEKSAGTTSRNLDIDYSWWAYQFSASRFP